MECTTVPSLTSLRSNALATALALGLGLSAGVAPAAPDPVQPTRGFGGVGDAAGAQMRRWLAAHTDAARAPVQYQTGATVPVLNCNAEGFGSLLQAVALADDGDIVDMSGLDCNLIILDSHLIINQDSLQLRGNGSTIITVNPGGDGIIYQIGTGNLTLSDLTLSDGVYENDSSFVATGGCVHSGGKVRLFNAILENCATINLNNDASGGAIYAAEGVEMRYSVISGSDAIGGPNGVGRGGGIYSPGGLLMKYSTLDDNRASGGLFGEAGGAWIESTTKILRSTLSNNNADNAGGLVVTSTLPRGIVIRSSTLSGNGSDGSPLLDTKAPILLRTTGDITIANNTIAANVNLENFGGGLFLAPGAASINLESNIVSANFAADGAPRESDIYIGGAGIDIGGGHNLIGEFDAAAGTGYSTPGDTIRQVGIAFLEPLQDNGGPTRTMAIHTGSWAFNLGTYAALGGEVPPYGDQRLLPREIGAGVDIGAFESDALFIGRFEDPPTSL